MSDTNDEPNLPPCEITKTLGPLRTVEQACKALSLCRSTLYSLMDAGRIRSVRYPGVRVRRIPQSEIDRLIVEGLINVSTVQNTERKKQ